MTAEELKQYILEHMTAEEALDKFIKSSIEHYEHLKGCTDANHEGNPLFIMAAAALDLGWELAIESTSPDQEVRGAIFGTEEYLNSVLGNSKEQADG